MALSLFAGTLTQYYRQTTHIHTGCSNLAKAHLADFSLDEDVLHWQKAMTDGLADFLDEPLYWQESNDKPNKFLPLKQDEFQALMLCAVYLPRSHLRLPDVLPSALLSDPHYRQDVTEDGHSCYPTILRPSLWLPNAFDFTFSGQNVVHEEVMIGSIPHLLYELENLEVDIAQACEEQDCSALVEKASEVLTDFKNIIRFSEQAQLPILLSDSAQSRSVM